MILAGTGILLIIMIIVIYGFKNLRNLGLLTGLKKLVMLVYLFGSFSCNQESLPTLDQNLTTEIIINSKEKGKTYRIWVQLPENYQSSGQKYPTLYVLDPDDKSVNGNTNFLYIAKKCNELSKKLGKSEVIIIGIRHGDYREIDYTPTKFSTKGFTGEGGGEAFMNFIKRELVPKVEKEFRAISQREQRGIIGHSLGGLCGAYAFAKHNEVFGNYLLLSPSLMYDDEIILQYEQETRFFNKSNPQLVFLGVGGTEANMVPTAELLCNRLTKHYSNAVVKLYINAGKGHNSSKDENIKEALLYYFQKRKL